MLRLRVQTIRSLLWLGNLVVILCIAGIMVKIGMKREELADWLDPKLIADRAKAVGTIFGSTRNNDLKDWPEYANLWELNVTGKEPPKAVEASVTGPVDNAPPMQPITDVLEVVFCGAWLKTDAAGTPIPGEYTGIAQIRYRDEASAAAVPGARGVTVPNPRGGVGLLPAAGAGAAAGLAADPGKRSVAQVSDRFLQIGQALRPPYNAPPFNGKVLSIGPEGVHFQWGDDEVIVPTPKMPDASVGQLSIMAGIDAEGNPTEGVRVEPKKPDPAQRESRQKGTHSWFIGSDDVARIRAEHESMVAEISVKTHYSKGDGPGAGKLRVMIDAIPEGSLAYQRGFRSGDVLRTVNGEEIQSKSAIVQYFKANQGKSTYRIEIERLGQVLTKTFEVSK